MFGLSLSVVYFKSSSAFFIGFLSYEEKTPKMHSIMLISFIFWEEDSWIAYFAACLYIAIHDCNQIKNISIFDFFSCLLIQREQLELSRKSLCFYFMLK